METVIFVMIMIFAVLLMIISSFRKDKTQPQRGSQAVALTTHARERMTERYGIRNEKQMYSFAHEAFIYGKSSGQLSGYLSRKLRKIEIQDEEPRIARFYQNSIFVFSTDGVLITLFPYEPQFHH